MGLKEMVRCLWMVFIGGDVGINTGKVIGIGNGIYMIFT